MRRHLLAVSLMAVVPNAMAAVNLDFLDPTDPNIFQSDFDLIASDLAAALNYKALGPSEATGVSGIGVGGFVSYTPVENEAAWKRLTREDIQEVGMAGVVVHKGLPFNIDLGAFYASLPGTDGEVIGGELRYAAIPGSTALPALTVRLSYTKLRGIDDLELETVGGDVSISKGFTFLTPYIGLGYLEATATPSARYSLVLRETELEKTRGFIGARIALGLFEITPEFEQVGKNSSYNLRLGLSF